MFIDYGVLASSNFVFTIIAFAAAVTLLPVAPVFDKRSTSLQILTVVALNGLAGTIAGLLLYPSLQLLTSMLFAICLNVASACLLRKFTFTGALVMTTQTQFYVASMLWGSWIVAEAHIDPLSRALMFVGFLLMCLHIIVALVQRLEQLEVTFRRDPRRPSLPITVVDRTHYPKVSVHVPVYSEPPELVIATLNALAELDYPNYEVLVIDNNTADPALWRPVEVYCLSLSQRFHFFHVDRLSGAKAGALNFALRHTSSDVELIGVVDSDYKVSRNYIALLVGFFDDLRVGFVQTPQAYRDWERYSYLRTCNWEYSLYLASTLVSRNERMAGITLGTMGLIRRKLLEEVGGWAEWCLTEDSELALRIHAQGYASMYFNAVLGRGLIPETFRDYKTQRFRWRYGSIQELRRHVSFFLPKPLGRPSSLTITQKLSHLMHAIDTLKSVLEFLVVVIGASLATSLLLQSQPVPIPSYSWPVFAVAALLALLLKWHVFRTLGWSLSDTLRAHFARAALDHTFTMAGFSALLTRNTAWRKTNKFRATPTGLTALRAATPEVILGGLLTIASITAVHADDTSGLIVLLSIGGLWKGAKYLFAPVLAVSAEIGIRQRATERGLHKRADNPLYVPDS